MTGITMKARRLGDLWQARRELDERPDRNDEHRAAVARLDGDIERLEREMLELRPSSVPDALCLALIARTYSGCDTSEDRQLGEAGSNAVIEFLSASAGRTATELGLSAYGD